jgi:hypothetical protein
MGAADGYGVVRVWRDWSKTKIAGFNRKQAAGSADADPCGKDNKTAGTAFLILFQGTSD